MNDFKYLISPLYLLPAVIGTLFYNFTRNRMIVNREVFYQFRTKDNTIHFQMEMTPFWGKDKHPYLLFFIPGFNIILLIGTIVEYLRSRKATRLYLQHNDYAQHNQNDKASR